MLAQFVLGTALVAMLGAVLPQTQAPVSLKGLPGELRWKNSPVSWKSDENGLTIVAGTNTNWFISPVDGEVSANSPLLLFQPAADFVLSARVKVDLRKQWAAGFLMVYLNDNTWAKLALELSAYKDPTIVTVVTRGRSDDCNSVAVAGDSVYLQIARTGEGLFFYSSPDGHSWKLVRAFTLGTVEGLRVGFAAQSPVGNEATAVFSEMKYAPRKISDIFVGQ